MQTTEQQVKQDKTKRPYQTPRVQMLGQWEQLTQARRSGHHRDDDH